MRVNSINNNYNTNFNGRIQSSPILNEIKGYANKASVERFEKMAERIAKFDDGLVFDFTKTKSYKMSANEVATIFNYNLLKTNERNKKVDQIYTVQENINTYSTFETIKQRKAMILDIITNFFNEQVYPEKQSVNKLGQILNNTI